MTGFHHWRDIAKFIQAYKDQHSGESPEQIRVDFDEWLDILRSAEPEMTFRPPFRIRGVPVVIKTPLTCDDMSR